MLQMGIDLARNRDRTALVTVEKHGPSKWLRAANRLPVGTDYAQQHKALSDALRGFSGIVAIDVTGVGAAVADMLEAEGHHLRRVTFTGGGQVIQRGNDWSIPKSILVELLLGAMEFGDLDLSAGGPDLYNELRAFTQVEGKYTGKVKGGTDDLVMALCLALFPFGELR